MRILITCATKLELEPLLNVHHKISETNVFFNLIHRANKHVDVLFSGVGMLSTAFHLTQHLAQHQYDLVLNVGIAGTVQSAEIGQVYQIVREHIYQLGVEDNDRFIPLQDMGFMSKQDPASEKFFSVCKRTESELPELEKALGITVNKVHGKEESIAAMHVMLQQEKETGTVLESMEGAAFAYVCRQLEQDAIEVRSVSNVVEVRNREHWRMKEAIEALNNFLIEYLA
jgi:futalosine hydrolase